MELHPSYFILGSYMAFFFQIFKISIENIRVDINILCNILFNWVNEQKSNKYYLVLKLIWIEL